jgi:hypothetical protein
LLGRNYIPPSASEPFLYLGEPDGRVGRGGSSARPPLRVPGDTALAAARKAAGYGEKSQERLAHRNGYRDRVWETRAGSVDGTTFRVD